MRLGELERHLSDGVIEEIVAAALGTGPLKKGQRRRLMSYPLVIRLMLAMTLAPDASYCKALARLAGLLADVPFALGWHVPRRKSSRTGGSGAGGPAGAPVLAGGRAAGQRWRAVSGAAVRDDRMRRRRDAREHRDTPENRAMFGSTGTGDDSAPFPQLRVVALTAQAGRAMLGAIPAEAGPWSRPCLNGSFAAARPWSPTA